MRRAERSRRIGGGRPDRVVSGSDASAGAVEVARANAERLGLAVPFAVVPGPPDGEYELVVANLRLEAAPSQPGDSNSQQATPERGQDPESQTAEHDRPTLKLEP